MDNLSDEEGLRLHTVLAQKLAACQTYLKGVETVTELDREVIERDIALGFRVPLLEKGGFLVKGKKQTRDTMFVNRQRLNAKNLLLLPPNT